MQRRGKGAVSEPLVRAGYAVADHVLGCPKKKNPAVGTPGQDFFLIGVYGF
jgi:hypothetical protein